MKVARKWCRFQVPADRRPFPSFAAAADERDRLGDDLLACDPPIILGALRFGRKLSALAAAVGRRR
jgi:hypothetical protein